MDTATAAGMSDPDRNKWFRRRWSEPPEAARSRLPKTPEPDKALEQIGSTLREQWRRERARQSRGFK
jgi:hypothetical protein